MKAMLAMLLLSTGDAAPRAVAAPGRFEVHAELDGEEPLLTVRAHEAPVERVLAAAARELGRELRGLDRVGPTAPLSIYLEGRPASTALHWIAGAAGLRTRLAADAIVVFDETSPFPTRPELFDAAETAYLRALRRAPEHAEAAGAELHLAEIQEDRGALAAAINHYDYLIGEYGDSPYVPEAMLRSGRHLASLGNWQAAAHRFEELARIEHEHAYHASARLELARALCELDDPEKALHALEALETHYPTHDPGERRARLLVRARAQALTGESIASLKTLDLATTYSAGGAADHEIRRISALALERAGKPRSAAVTWMGIARDADGDERGAALEAAARLALQGGDELGVLMLHAWAASLGVGDRVLVQANEARRRLGLEPLDLQALTAEQRVARGEELFGRGATAEAVSALELVYRNRERLAAPLRVRLAQVYARALSAEGLIDSAVKVLRDAAETLDKLADRERLYVLASELYEHAGRVEEAIEAMRGRL